MSNRLIRTGFNKIASPAIVFIALVSLSYVLTGCGASVVAGKGINASQGSFTASPNTVDFGSVNVGNSANNTVSLANTSTDPVVVSQLTVSGNSSFSLNGQNQLPMTLAPGTTTDVKVHYNPASATDDSGNLTITSNSAVVPTASVKLHGKGSKGGSSTTTALSAIACASASITGAGTDACTVTLTAAAPTGGFSVGLASNNAALTVPSSVTVPANATSAAFTATASAVTTAQSVTLSASSGGVTKTFALQLSPSSGSSPSTPALSSISCSKSSITGAGTDACTVTLTAAAPTGGASVGLASNNAALTVPSSVTVPASATSAAFTATASAVTTAQSVTLTANAGGATKTFAVQLSPAGGSTLGMNATSISFGNVVLNTPSTQSVILTATGTSAITVSAATVTGTGFSLPGAKFPMTVSPGTPATLSVQFDPTSSGAATGQLTVTNTSSNNSNAAISLSGTGVSHQIALSWNAPSSSSDTISGYNVYRAPSGSSSYQKLTSSVNAQTSYTDTTAQSSTTYQYYVTSIDSTGAESTPSNTATVVVP